MKKNGQSKTFTDAEKECEEHIELFNSLNWYSLSTKDWFKHLFNTEIDLIFGDIMILLPSGGVYVDAKRNGYVSENSINNFKGQYYFFYWPKEDCMEFAPTKSVKAYFAKVKASNKLITLPHSGEPGYKFKPGDLYTALTLEQMIEKQKQYE